MENFREVAVLVGRWVIIMAGLIILFPIVMGALELFYVLFEWLAGALKTVSLLWDRVWESAPTCISQRKDIMWEFILFAVAAIVLKDGIVALLNRHESTQYEEEVQ